MTVLYAEWTLVVSVLVVVLAIPLFWLLRPGGPTPPTLGLLVLLLAVGGAVGALGRLADADPSVDYWVRIVVLGTRVAAASFMAYEIVWLRRKR